MLDARERLSTANAAASGPHSAGSGRKGLDLPLHFFLVIIGFLTYLPFALMLVISFKTRAQFAVQPIWPTLPLHFENYSFAFRQVLRPVINTIVVCVGSISVTLFVASLAAYSFARFRFPGAKLLFTGIISLLMIPQVLLLVPRYVITGQLHLLGNQLGLIIPYIASGEILAIFIMRTFFAAIPGELMEAARVDGASHWMIYWRIILPLSKPILATLGIIQLISLWNDFIWPFVVITKHESYTLALILRTFAGDFGTQWGLIMACYVTASLPLLFVFALASKQFIRGLTAGAIKF